MRKEIREAIKRTIIAQGKVYNYNINNIVAKYGCTYTEACNALNYYTYSPQQQKFRDRYLKDK